MNHLPLVDLHAPHGDVARDVGLACRAHGFFYVTGNGVDESLVRRLEELSRRFFALPDEVKARYAMVHDGRATRWDAASVHAFEGTYGDYVLAKVGRVFPDLMREVR